MRKIRLGVLLCFVGALGCAAYGFAFARTSASPGWTAASVQEKQNARGSIRLTMDQLYAERDIAGEISRFDRVPQVAETAAVADAGDVLPKGVNPVKMRATQERMNTLYAAQNIRNEIMTLDKSAPVVAAGAGKSK